LVGLWEIVGFNIQSMLPAAVDHREGVRCRRTPPAKAGLIEDRALRRRTSL
jgi:hypothetical protein